MTKAVKLSIFILFSAFCANSQTLTVREIMAEPSIAGMRAEGEKLSPDGSKVVFLWNAEGKMPRDLYLSSTDKADAKVILRASDLPKPSATPTPESKLTYGLIVKDDFVKSRENPLGGFEWSPDSTKLVFSHGGDLYVLTVVPSLSKEEKDRKWANVETLIRRRSALIRDLIGTYEQAITDTEFIAWLKKNQKNLDVSMQSGGSWESQRQIILQIDATLQQRIGKFLDSTVPEQLRSNEKYTVLLDELRGAGHRVLTARFDYHEATQGNIPKRYTKTQSPETGARFLDNDRIIFQQNGNFFVLNTADATTVQLTKEANLQAFITVGGGIATKDAKLIAYTVSDSSKFKPLFVPNYLDEFTAAPTVRRGWSEQKLYVTAADGSRDTPFEIKLPKQEGVGNFRGIKWAADNRSLIVDRGDKDTKRRQLFYVYNAGSKDEKIILITEETDEKWQAPLSAIFEPNPKNPSELFFASERDGYNHLYLAKLKAETRPVGSASNVNERVAEGGEGGYSSDVSIKQLTTDNWQVEWAKWMQDGKIVFVSTLMGTETRAISKLDATTRQISGSHQNQDDRKMVANPQIADHSSVLIYNGSRWNRPDDLFSVQLDDSPRTESKMLLGSFQLTSTVPAAFSSIKWSEPKFFDIPSRDGKQIKAKIYLPAGHSTKKKYPMVVFVHGAGYLQNTINGWNNYYREFMFNELLTQKGYVVLDIDYRGSAGYGRDWRTDVYDFLGGKDYDDHIDSIDFMVKNYAVNPAKVGVYGGSYGGFMAGMLVTRAPDKIAAAAALRPVFDWKNYYASSPGYTAQRLGFPDKNPEAYKRSSPITYADKLERPLLILHGIVDDNVHVQDSQQMIEKLIRLGKSQYVEAMLYPAENHGFVRPSSWIDEYERILAFFEKHLK